MVGLGFVVGALLLRFQTLAHDLADLLHALLGQSPLEESGADFRRALLAHFLDSAGEDEFLARELADGEVFLEGDGNILAISGGETDEPLRETGQVAILGQAHPVAFAPFQEADGLDAGLRRGLAVHRRLEVDDGDVRRRGGALDDDVLRGGLRVPLQRRVDFFVAHAGGRHADFDAHVLGKLEAGNDGERGVEHIGAVFLHGCLRSAEVQHLEAGILGESLVLDVALETRIKLFGDQISIALGDDVLGRLAGAEARDARVLHVRGQNVIPDGGHRVRGHGDMERCLAIARLVDTDVHGVCRRGKW